MAITVGGVAIDLEANAITIVREMERAAQATLRSSQRMQRSLEGVSTRFSVMERGFSRIRQQADTVATSFRRVGSAASFPRGGPRRAPDHPVRRLLGAARIAAPAGDKHGRGSRGGSGPPVSDSATGWNRSRIAGLYLHAVGQSGRKPGAQPNVT